MHPLEAFSRFNPPFFFSVDYSLEEYQQGKVLKVNKPYGRSSFWVVNFVRRTICKHFGIKKLELKVGHVGTLDPLATGLLILCTGKATKTIEEIQATEKEYIATIQLGVTSASLDLETTLSQVPITRLISRKTIAETLQSQFTGTIQQSPPLYSAIHFDGIRAYELARKGESIEIPTKTVTIKDWELLDFYENRLTLRLVCSKGTYIRSIARDLGLALGTGGCLLDLHRSRIGNWTLESF